ncbi:hypothetical protein Tco_0780966 [Tanacetum coccineum]
MDDPNITMEEYIRLEEEKSRKRGKVSVETEFPVIAFIDEVSSEKTLSCEPTVSSLNDEIDFRVSFDDSDDEDYTVIFDKNSFSYKKISTNDLKTDSENDNEKVMPSLSSPEPTVSCFDYLDFFKDFENEFPAIVYNDAQTSKSDLLTEPILSPQHIDEFDLNDETSVSKYDKEEHNILYFNDLFPFNIIYLNDLKSEKDNEIDIIQSSKGNEITHGSNVLSETSHNKINKTFRTGSFVINLNVNIVIWNYYANGILFYLIMNLYVSFGIPFDPKRYYKDGDCALMLRRPSRALFDKLLEPIIPVLCKGLITMNDNRTMAQLLEAPTVGYEDAIVVPEITTDNFELKHGLLTLVQNKQFFQQDHFYDEVPERPEYVGKAYAFPIFPRGCYPDMA